MTTETRWAADETSRRASVERRHQFALGEPDQVGAVDDVVGVALQRGAGAGEVRVLVRELEQVAHHSPARGAVVAEQNLGGAQVQLLDGGEPRQPDRFAGEHDRQRQRGEDGKRKSERSRGLSLRANRSSIRFTMPSPVPSTTSPPSADQNSVPQRKPRRAGSSGASTGTGSSEARAPA